MDAGLFTLNCPQCATTMQLGPTGTSTCTACQLTYMTRFGYFIPIEHQPIGMNESAGMNESTVPGRAEPPVSTGATGAAL